MAGNEKPARNRGKYFVVYNDGTWDQYDSKPELTKALSVSGTADDVAHIFKGHRLTVETEKIDRVTVT